MLNRDAILNLGNDIKIEKVELGDDFVYLKEMTGSERDSYEQSLYNMERNKLQMAMDNARAKLLVKVICDEDGTLLFKSGDIQAVGNLPSSIADKLFSKAQEMNGLSDKDVDELTKN